MGRARLVALDPAEVDVGPSWCYAGQWLDTEMIAILAELQLGWPGSPEGSFTP